MCMCIIALTLTPNLTLIIAASVQVGINYTGTAKELNGCVNDAKNVRNFLMSRFYSCVLQCSSSTHSIHPTGHWKFKPEDIVVLTDGPQDLKDPRRLPTKANILGAMKWLVKGAKQHDSLFFHCE